MIPIEYELEKLTRTCYDMFEIVNMQLKKSMHVILDNEMDMADEVIRKEIRVNALELNIERECENILALKTPAATDFRFVIAILKISNNLERIGDHAFHISEFKIKGLLGIDNEKLEMLGLNDMFKTALSMMDDAVNALEKKDSELAKSLFKKDKVLDKITDKAPAIIEKLIKGKGKDVKIEPYIHIYRIIGKIERIGDLIKNIAEEIIFYIESDIIRHKKRNKKIFRTYIKEQ